MLAALLVVAPVAWFGPVTVSFNLMIAGNPYDPEQNDLKVRFMPEKGKAEERLAYVDYDGTVRSTIVTQNPGRFRAVLVRNGKDLLTQPTEGIIDVSRRAQKGFIRVNPEYKNRFQWDNGEPYYPLGFNLGWQKPDQLPLRDQIGKMSQNGINWTRMYATRLDEKDPWWPVDDPTAAKLELWPKALSRWEQLLEACDLNNIAFQMVLFNEIPGAEGSSWEQHPWNATNGGFLKSPSDFFTDEEAKRRAKMWLRYAVARYGHFPSLMSWDLFAYGVADPVLTSGSSEDVWKWHREMADYLKSIDPYDHLITTGFTMGERQSEPSVDFYQKWLRSTNVGEGLAQIQMPSDKPSFVQELYSLRSGSDSDATLIRDGIYGEMLANRAGAAQFWHWDVVEKNDLYREFRTASAVLNESGLALRPTARPLTLKATNGTVAKGLGESDWALVRLTHPNAGTTVTIDALSIADGNYEFTQFDLESGEKTSVTRAMQGFQLASYRMPSRDVVLLFKRKLS